MKVTIDGWANLQKSDLTSDQLSALRQALTIIPKKVGDHPGEAPGPLRLYAENSVVFRMPRQFFLNRRKPGHEVEFRVTEGDKSTWPGDLEFAGTLRDEQLRGLHTVVSLYRAGCLGGIYRAVPGSGKCLGLGTPVLKFDGTIVPVESIQAGDQLMGPDSTPRTALSTTRGTGPLYRVVPVRGRPWVCNDAHILTFVRSSNSKRPGGEVSDLPLQEWLRMTAAAKHHLKQFTPLDGVDFLPAPPLPLDPYFLGVWYGDGTKRLAGIGISKPDAEIEAVCRDIAKQFDLQVRVDFGTGGCPTYHIHRASSVSGSNPLLTLVCELVGDGTVFPHAYLTASRADRQAFLAGLLDTDGHLSTGVYDIIQKQKGYAEGICFLARSLGISAMLSEKKVNGDSYWRVGLSGAHLVDLPLRIARKRPSARLQKKVTTRTGISVESLGDGEYAGFTLDGDGRFLLGDFTVTHNTVSACAIAKELQVPTLVVVHKEFLMDQWISRIQQFLPGAQIGIAQGPTCDFKGKHFVLGMVHSLAENDYGEEFRNWPGHVITDESLPGHARVLTEWGYRPIQELVELDAPVRVVAYDQANKRFVFRPITRRWVHAPRSQMLRVQHEHGIFECTAEHVVITPMGDVHASALVPGVDCVVCYRDDRPDRALQSPAGVDSGLDHGGRLFIAGRSVQGQIPGESRNSSEAVGRGEVRAGVRVVYYTAADSSESRVYDEGCVFLLDNRERGLTDVPQSDIPGRHEAGEPGSSGGVLVSADDGLVVDGRRQCGYGAVTSAPHRTSFSHGSRAAGGLVHKDGVPGPWSESSDPQSTDFYGVGFQANGSVRVGLCASSVALQGGPVSCTSSGETLHSVRSGHSAYSRGKRDAGEVWASNLLPCPSLPSSSSSGGFGALLDERVGNISDVFESEMSGVFRTDGSERDGYDHTQVNVLGTMSSCVVHSGLPEEVLRSPERRFEDNLGPSRVLSVTPVDTPELVYDLSIEEHHNFVVEGVVLHNCFPAWTRVSTPQGPRAIATFQPGDSVLCAAGASVVEGVSSRLVSSSDLRTLRLASGTSVLCTVNHPFLTEFGWLPAGHLVGRKVLTSAGCVASWRVSWMDARMEAMMLALRSRLASELTDKTAPFQVDDFRSVPGGPPFTRVDSIEEMTPASLQAVGWEPEEPGLYRVHNLAVRRHPSYILEDAGVLAHNCHRIGAATWSQVPPMFPAKWRTGLSATPRRKDGADAVFHHHIGEVIFASKEVRMTPKIRRVWITPDKFKLLHTNHFNPDLVKKTMLLKFMCMSPGRNRVIAEQIVLAAKAGRKSLVVSERLQHLRDLETALYQFWGDSSLKPSVGYYIGGESKESLEAASKAQVILATAQLVQEGLDIPSLDTLFMTTPLSDIEQVCVPPGTMVWSGHHPVELQTLVTGNYVTGGPFGEQGAVTKVWNSTHKGFLVDVRAMYLESFSLTPNHVLPVREYRRARVDGKKKKVLGPQYELPAGELLGCTDSRKKTSGLAVGLPIYSCVEPCAELTPEVVELLGYYVAEGNISSSTRVNRRTPTERARNLRVKMGKTICFSFGSHETYLAERVRDLAEQVVGAHASIKLHGSVLRTNVYSTKFAELVQRHIGGNSRVRALSRELMSLPVPLQEIFIRAAHLGDGCWTEHSRNSTMYWRYSSSSRVLVLQLQMLLLRQGRIASVLHKPPSESRFSELESWELTESLGSRGPVGVIEGGMLWSNIVSVGTRPYEGLVHNLSVDPQEHYALTGGLVHNCGRILRPHEGKKEPIVVDFRDDHIPLCQRYAEFRDKFYAKMVAPRDA